MAKARLVPLTKDHLVGHQVKVLHKKVAGVKQSLRSPTMPVYDPDFPVDAVKGQIAINGAAPYWFDGADWQLFGGAGGGLQFVTYPQDGLWLYVKTTNAAAGSPNGYGIELKDTSSGGVLLEAQNADLKLHGGTGIEIATTIGGAGIALSAYQINAVVNPAGGSLFLQAPEIDLAYGAGGLTVFNPSFATVLQVITVAGVTQYHIKTGAVWVADL